MNRKTLQASTVAAAALLSLAAAGCTDLTTEPKSTITDANIFNDQNSYRALLAKLYAGLAVTGQRGQFGQPDITFPDEGFTQYVRLLWEMEELPTDEAVIAWGGDAGLTELNTQSWGTNNVFPQMMYYRIFFQVPIANEFLRQTTDAKLASRGVGSALRDTIKTYRAEARFLRALSYWHAIDLFGNVPLVTEADQPGAAPPKQATRSEIYAFVVSELLAIKPDLPQVGPNSYGRATAPAADMLLAKLYLNAGVYTGTPNYAGALTSAQAVINSGFYSLDPNYHRMFLADNNTSPEIIFAVTQDGLRTQGYGCVTFLVHASVGDGAPAYGIAGGWYGLRLKPQAAAFYPSGDVRNAYFDSTGRTPAVSVMTNWGQGILAPKYQNVKSNGQPGSDNTFVDTDYPMFRLAEAHLIYAEAHLRGGGGTDSLALAYVNALRQRAYGGTTGNITLPQLTLPFVLAERGRELLWEGHRRTDLVRYGMFTGSGYLYGWKGGTELGIATLPKYDLYPLPATELVANPNLKQNPGY